MTSDPLVAAIETCLTRHHTGSNQPVTPKRPRMSTKINTDEIRSRLLLSGNYDTPNIIHNWQQLSALTEHLLNEIDRLNKVTDFMAKSAQSEAWAIKFRVLGKPAPQGSKTRMPNGAIVEGKSTKGRQEHKAWRTAVAETAHANRHDTPLDGPLLVRIELRMPRPKARKTALYCDRRPDVDKIARTCLDALTDSGIIADDNRVVELTVVKMYADPADPWTGADIRIMQLTQLGGAA